MQSLRDAFLEWPIIIPEREHLTTFSQFLHTYLDHRTITEKLCMPGGQFILNAEGTPWKILWKDLTTLTQTWTVLSYFNLAPTSHTSYLNMDRTRLIYELVMKMHMDLGRMISS